MNTTEIVYRRPSRRLRERVDGFKGRAVRVRVRTFRDQMVPASGGHPRSRHTRVMCSNYRPVTRLDRLLTFFGVERARDDTPLEVWPLNLAPFIRLAEDGSGQHVVDDGTFGLLPHFATELAFGRRTYNARSETVATLPSFRQAWGAGQRCIVPAESVFEPSWETGKAVRWCVQQAGAMPMGIGGVWRRWRAPDGRQLSTFAMLTVNADGHPVFGRLHKPGEEKRMVLILDAADYGAWLSCAVDEAARFFEPWGGPLEAFAAPLPPRASSVRTSRHTPPTEQDGLF